MRLSTESIYETLIDEEDARACEPERAAVPGSAMILA